MDSLCENHHECDCRRCEFKKACYRVVATLNYDPKNVVAIQEDLSKVGEAICVIVYDNLYMEREMCATLVLIMKMHAMRHATIAQTSLRLVGLFIKCCDTARCRLIAAGICPVITNLLRHQGSKDRDVAMWSCGVVTLLLRQREATGPGAHFVINRCVFDPVVCTELVAAVRAHKLHVDTVTWVPAIAALCYDNTDVNRLEFKKLGVEEMLRELVWGKRARSGSVGDGALKVRYVSSADMKEYALEVADMLL